MDEPNQIDPETARFINELLARSNAAVVLAADATIVKAWPHSLIEALVAGRPVLVSQCIPMADYVSQKGCGVVLDSLNPDAVCQAVNELMSNYGTYQANAQQVSKEDFAPARMLNRYEELYRQSLTGDKL